MTKRFRHGVVKRSSPERRTFGGVIYDSLIERFRAEQLGYEMTGGMTLEVHPIFELGCPENKYTADFKVIAPLGESHRFADDKRKRNGGLSRTVKFYSYYVEEIKGPVRKGIGRLKTLWKAYGPVPLVILTPTHPRSPSTGWIREIVLPKSLERK